MTKPRIVVVLTSHDRLGDNGEKAGFHYEELTTPWYIFQEAGLDVVLGSIEGGKPPADPASLPEDESERPASLRRFLKDDAAMKALENTHPVAELKAKDFDAVYIPGGHGCMWDMPDNDDLSRLISEVFEKGGVVGSVCHGPAALIGARLSDGSPLVRGRRINSFTDEEERESGKDKYMPFMLETELRGLGAKFENAPPSKPITVRDDNLVTGQNPASAKGVGKGIVEALRERRKEAAE